MLTFALLAVCLPYAHAEQYWVSIGSYRQLENAEEALRAAVHTLDKGASIERLLVEDLPMFRVLVGPQADEQRAREAVNAARSSGFATAWLLTMPAEPATAAATAVIPAPEASRREENSDQENPGEESLEESPNAVAASTVAPRIADDARLQTVSSADTLPETLTLSTRGGEAITLLRIDLEREPMKVDGHLDEPFWQRIPAIDQFLVLEPDTLVPGAHETYLRVAYSDKGLHISADMKQPTDTLVQRLSGRDMRDNRDSFSVTLDTSGEGRYGFWFGINLGDSLMDGTVLPERKFTSDWDGPWYGRSQQTADGWTAEYFIPWGVVSMPAASEQRNMGIYASRKVAYLDERWGWPALPPTQAKFMSALQSVNMRGVQPRQQYSVYPFMATAYDRIDERQLYRAGVDVFWRPSSNFQLNATLNPDFGNVESDEVDINLTATETFFPEKRLFFLEGQEIFVASPRADTRGRGVGNQGLPYTMVNTRRIGGVPRTPQVSPGITVPERELRQQTELVGAFKTTGQLGRFRYGFLGAQEEEVKFDVLDGTQPRNLKQDGNDYGIARLLYEDNVGGGYRAVGVLSTAVLNPERDAVAHGLDWHYLSPRGGLKVDGQYMMSDIDDVEEKGYGGFLDFELTYRQGLKHRIGLEYFDENFDINDLGFLQRNNEYRLRSSLQWTRADLGWARENQFDVRGFYQKSVTESLTTGGGIFFSDRLRLNDLSTVIARFNYFLSVYDDLNSFGNGTFKIEDKVDTSLNWVSDSTRVWSYGAGAGYAGENLGGDSYYYDASLNWRPSDRFAVEFAVKYFDRDEWLLHQGGDLFATFDAEQWQPKLSVEYYISARQQMRLSLQWIGIRAEERDFYRIPGRPGDLLPTAKPTGPGARANYDFSVSQYALQARYRWEIAPLSDIFLVYTRQADLRTALGQDEFSDLLQNAWEEPLADILVFKIRYRFGS